MKRCAWRWRRWHACAAGVCVVLAMSASALARTIELNAWDLAGFAVISSEAPRLSWVANHSGMPLDQPKYFGATSIDLYQPRQMMVRFDLSRIPKGMRVTSAELIMPVTYQGQPTTRMLMSRLTAAWGPGVCYQYRMTRPEKIAWKQPGAAGGGTDRALGAAARIHVTQPATEMRVNVTADIELWHVGGTGNHGWIIATENPADRVIFASPIWQAAEKWKLRVTFEPE